MNRGGGLQGGGMGLGIVLSLPCHCLVSVLAR